MQTNWACLTDGAFATGATGSAAPAGGASTAGATCVVEGECETPAGEANTAGATCVVVKEPEERLKKSKGNKMEIRIGMRLVVRMEMRVGEKIDLRKEVEMGMGVRVGARM